MSKEIRVISTPDAPAAKGPYNQGMVYDGLEIGRAHV